MCISPNHRMKQSNKSSSSTFINSFLPNSLLHDLSFDSSFSPDDLNTSTSTQYSKGKFHPPKPHQYSDLLVSHYYKPSQDSFIVTQPTKKTSEVVFPKMNIEHDVLNYNISFTAFLNSYGGILSTIMKKNIGSRYLQKMIDTISSNDINLFFYFTSKNIKELMCDQYANYFIQKIISKCNYSQRIFLYSKLKYDFISIAKNICGTHCLQALIENISSQQEENFIFHMTHGHLNEFAFDANGSHVIKKIIEKIAERKREYINQFVLTNIIKLSKNANSICIVKQFITCNKDERIKAQIILSLANNIFDITQDLYGNYVVQHLIETFGYYNCFAITRIICLNFVLFSTQKYSSNVVDKVIIELHNNNHNELVQMINQMFFDDSNLFELLNSKYGTFVLANCLKILSQNEQNVIKNLLKEKFNFHKDEHRTIFCRLRRLMQ